MTDPKWQIESEFRNGSARVRDEHGKYRSLSNVILEKTSEVDSFTETELATTLGLDKEIIVEHLHHLKKHELLEQVHGLWRKPNDFDPGESFMREQTEEEEWEAEDDETLY